MGDAERLDPDLGELVKMASTLSPARRSELVDFAAFLAAREAREQPAAEMAEEDRAWMEADLSNLAAWEPFDWGPDGPPAGQPVKWDAARGAFVIEGASNDR
jgi:hypothetical protein